MFKREVTNRLDGIEEGSRRGRRLALSCRVFFCSDENVEGEGRLLDLSTSGCRMASDEPLQVGMVLKLSLFLPDHTWTMMIDQALVRWVDGDRAGLEFTSIRTAQRERLRAMIMK
jgi:PilZ domain